MPKADLNLVSGTYAPVADRVALFYQSHPSGRIVTTLVSRADGAITFRAAIYSNKDIAHDLSANVSLTTRTEMDYFNGSNVLWDATKYYYDAGDRLAILNRAIGPYANDETHPGERNVFEEYRYDAFGRRVGTRTRRSSSCSTAIAECVSVWTRTVWDGDQVALEIRTPGHDGVPIDSMEATSPVGSSGSNYPYGRVAYVSAGGIDQPIAAIRYGLQSITDPYVIYPHANWRGQYEVGHKPDGTMCYATSTCVEIAWPGATTSIDGVKPNPNDGPAWFGSLITGNTDGSGQSYLRNRYYDPATGRFTQEDPIGLSGGTNAYAFAGGDRINFSDPLGLCPKNAGGDGKSDQLGDCEAGTSGYYANKVIKGEGKVLNTYLGLGASCGESGLCEGAALGLGGTAVGMVAGAGEALGLSQYLRAGMRTYQGQREFRVAGKVVDWLVGEERVHLTSTKVLNAIKSLVK